MAEHEVRVMCWRCKGDGIVDIPGGGVEVGDSCNICNGTGYRADAYLSFQPNHIYTYQIIEATVTAEYTALSAANKDRYRIIVSSGHVDLSDGTAIRDALTSMFGAGTTTRANLLALLT